MDAVEALPGWMTPEIGVTVRLVPLPVPVNMAPMLAVKTAGPALFGTYCSVSPGGTLVPSMSIESPPLPFWKLRPPVPCGANKSEQLDPVFKAQAICGFAAAPRSCRKAGEPVPAVSVPLTPCWAYAPQVRAEVKNIDRIARMTIFGLDL